jgi:hypothetical protein
MNRFLRDGVGMSVLNVVFSSVGLVALVIGGWLFVSVSGDAVFFGFQIAVALIAGGATVGALPVLVSRRTARPALVAVAWIVLAIAALFLVASIALMRSWGMW